MYRERPMQTWESCRWSTHAKIRVIVSARWNCARPPPVCCNLIAAPFICVSIHMKWSPVIYCSAAFHYYRCHYFYSHSQILISPWHPIHHTRVRNFANKCFFFCCRVTSPALPPLPWREAETWGWVEIFYERIHAWIEILRPTFKSR